MPDATARLFLALDPPPEIGAALGAWQDRELGDPALRPVSAGALHFTLIFLGTFPVSAVERVAEHAFSVVTDAPEVGLAPDPVRRPARGPARLYALEGHSEACVEMQAAMATRLEAAGLYEPERRPFWPHLTVARVRREPGGRGRYMRVEREPGPLPDGLRDPFRCVRVALYRSNLRPQGADYMPLRTLELNN